MIARAEMEAAAAANQAAEEAALGRGTSFAPTSVRPPPNFHTSRRNLAGEAEAALERESSFSGTMRSGASTLPPVQYRGKSPGSRVSPDSVI